MTEEEVLLRADVVEGRRVEEAVVVHIDKSVEVLCPKGVLSLLLGSPCTVGLLLDSVGT